MTTRRLYEAGKLVEGKTSQGTWPIRIITEGKGSSGTYNRQLLEEYKDVFSSRAMFGNHPSDPSKPWERSAFDIKAKLGPNIEYKIVDGVAGVYGEAIVSPEVDKWLEEFHDVIGVSIFASGDGREEDGEWIVESFDGDDPYTSVDFVVAPGRGGGVESRMLEAYRAIETSAQAGNGSASAASHVKESKEQSPMEIEELATEVKGLSESITALLAVMTPLAESLKPEVKPDVDVAAAAVEADRKAEESEIPVELRTAILEAAKTGGDVDAAIASAKTVVDAVKSRLTESHESEGRFGGAGTVEDAAAYVPKGF